MVVWVDEDGARVGRVEENRVNIVDVEGDTDVDSDGQDLVPARE